MTGVCKTTVPQCAPSQPILEEMNARLNKQLDRQEQIVLDIISKMNRLYYKGERAPSLCCPELAVSDWNTKINQQVSRLFDHNDMLDGISAVLSELI